MYWNPPWRISILANFRGINFHAVVVFGLSKDLLFKSVLGHCAPEKGKNHAITKSKLSIVSAKQKQP